jgi:nucleotidyltransferase/DNA polymerase involved in DNA repair
MDAFYASIEQRDHPELRGRPVVVGADPQGGKGRGVVATASYEARRFGIGSAMPISQAYKLCPTASFVPPNMERYAEVSHQVMEILRRFSDCVEPVSIDEAFLDVTGSARAVIAPGTVLGEGVELARRLKDMVRAETELTASVGMATSKLLAKIASDMRKPDGLVVVPPGTEETFLAPLPVRRLWGVGPKMEEALARLGITTIGALAALPPEKLERRIGHHGHDLQALARGLDDRPVVSEGDAAKSMGHEHTFSRDVDDLRVLRQTVLELCDAVAERLRRHGTRARTVTLKYRDETFTTLTRAATLDEATDAGDQLFGAAWRLFGKVHGRRRVRLLGVSASGLVAPPQLGLFPTTTKPADRVRDALAARFGEGTITRASLLGPGARNRVGLGPGDGTTTDRKGSRRLRR